MKIEVVFDGQVVSTQWNVDPSSDVDQVVARRQALRSAIENGKLRMSQALRANVNLVDDEVVREGVPTRPRQPDTPKNVIRLKK